MRQTNIFQFLVPIVWSAVVAASAGCRTDSGKSAPTGSPVASATGNASTLVTDAAPARTAPSSSPNAGTNSAEPSLDGSVAAAAVATAPTDSDNPLATSERRVTIEQLLAEPPPAAPTNTVRSNDTLSWTVGNSRIHLTQAHTFVLEPLGISGRSISGWWIFSDAQKKSIDVVGTWSWLNGASQEGDFRRMKVRLNTNDPVDADRAKRISADDFAAAVARSKAAPPVLPIGW